MYTPSTDTHLVVHLSCANLDFFNNTCTGSLPELIKHGLIALGETIGSQEETGLTPDNTSVAVVGENQPFKLIEGSELKPYVRYPPQLIIVAM